jgi:hypothetical protein
MRNQRMSALIIASVLTLAAAACDIVTEPRSTVTDANVFTDRASYRYFLAKLYGGLSLTGQVGPHGNGDFPTYSDEGFTQYSRQLWQLQELPTDEAVIQWGDVGLPELVKQEFSSSNQFIGMMYYRVFYQVALTNEFLRQTTAEKLAERGHSDMAEEIALYRAEARFLRALSYWHGLDLWGNIPLVDENFPPGATPPEQSTPDAIYAFIVSELTDIRDDVMPAGAEYGRADQATVAMLLAKLYLNAEVYTGTAQYAAALTEIETVIGGPYSLPADYQNNFLADNNTSPEFIFAIPYDGLNTRTWGGTTFLAHAGCGGTMTPADYGLDFCWSGLRVKPEFVALFPAPQDTSPDSRAILWSDGQNLQVTSISNFNDGWGAPKYKNVTSTGDPGSNPTHPDTDFPMFRLADAYLMYAEAVVRGGGGNAGTAAGYVNALRERAYGNTDGNIVEADLTLPFILDERARELWWEGHRRTDLIRFGVFTGDTKLWAWKGGVEGGAGTEATKNLYPIPAAELLANPNLVQNAGY